MKNKISDEHFLFSIIKNVLDYDQNSDVPVAVESMDDCALIKISDTHSLAISSDFVRGSGFYLFELGLLNYFDVGYYLITANLSDLASMGAEPIGLTTVIRYADMDDKDFRNVFEGMKLAADEYNTQIIGGDIGGHKADVFVATAFGRVKTSEALLRKNVQDGDLLCVTGTVGLPITALTYFKEVKKTGFSLQEEEEERILSSWKRPTPRIYEGILLSSLQLANACQDVSDGLKATIEQMSELSGKTFSVYSDKIPIENSTIKLADFLQIDPIQIAISASVDFELLFTISQENRDRCLEEFNKRGFKMTIIGEVNNLGRNVLLDSNNVERSLPGTVWKQQQSDDYLKQIIYK
ncbi:thiamine-phosphate kinase [Spirosoma sp. 209]|uniref:thiamine-phosphate kinase n=1 Tax=Spirosoma sp. 209 TaxID=1955701 RepID=UPI00098D1EF2|nr:thiamine-phosphate kinase [Spirosoma sp. 209]